MVNERVVRLPGVDLHVEVQDGEPSTVFLHGFGADLRTWDGFWDFLPAGRGYLRYDLRGFGRSIALNTSLFHHSDDLLGLMDDIGIDRCDLVGVSMGGSVALNFALSRPDRVRSLGLLSPGLTAWEWSDEWRALWQPIVRAARSGDLPLARRLWSAHPLFDTTRGGSAADRLHEEISRYSGQEWIDDRQSPALPDLDRLHELETPLLLLTGKHDLADFRLIADLIEASAGDVWRHDADELGHMVHLENPAWCCERLVAFWHAVEKERH